MNQQTRDLSIKLSKQKARARELLKMETRSEDDQTELDGLDEKIEASEKELRTAMLADEDTETREQRETDTGEDRELRSLAGQANLGTIFHAVLEHRAVDGAERELQQHFDLTDNQVPLMLLEQRAATAAPGDVGAQQQEILTPVFAQACAAFLGVPMPRVAVGDSVYPVLTTRASVGGPHTDSTEVGESTGTFTAQVLEPSRIQASFFYRRTDRARFRGMDEALRANLSDALADKLDAEVIAGSDGLLNGTNLPNHNVNAVTSYADYLAEFGYSRVDGRYASSVSDLRAVVGASTYAHMGAAYRNNSVDRNAIDRLMTITGGIKVSAHVPGTASHKQNAVIRRGNRRAMVAPVWEGVTLIPDEVTKAAAGEIVITAVMLHAVKIIRAGTSAEAADFYKQQTQHA